MFAVGVSAVGSVSFFRGPRGRLFCTLLQQLVVCKKQPVLLGLVTPCLSLCLRFHMAFSLCPFTPSSFSACLSLCPKAPFYKGSSPLGLGPTLVNSFSLDYLCKPYFQIKSHSEILGLQDIQLITAILNYSIIT